MNKIKKKFNKTLFLSGMKTSSFNEFMREKVLFTIISVRKDDKLKINGEIFEIFTITTCDKAETGSEKVQEGGESRAGASSGGAVATEVHRSLFPYPQLLQVTMQSIDADVVFRLHAFAASSSENFHGKRAR